jgi:hypothetical protein
VSIRCDYNLLQTAADFLEAKEKQKKKRKRNIPFIDGNVTLAFPLQKGSL